MLLVPPPKPVADPVPGTGTVAPTYSVGTITLTDQPTSVSTGTFSYGDGGYSALPASYTSSLWPAGDTLTVAASGGAGTAAEYLDGFTVSAPVLAPPVLDVPSPLALADGVTISWQPDPNATTMEIILGDVGAGGTVGCTVPDAQAAVSIDAQMFAAFQSGDDCSVVANRYTQRSASSLSGTIVFESAGWTSIETTVH
jgi:hypothetical protein